MVDSITDEQWHELADREFKIMHGDYEQYGVRWCRSHRHEARWKNDGREFCCVEYVCGPCDVVGAQVMIFG